MLLFYFPVIFSINKISFLISRYLWFANNDRDERHYLICKSIFLKSKQNSQRSGSFKKMLWIQLSRKLPSKYSTAIERNWVECSCERNFDCTVNRNEIVWLTNQIEVTNTQLQKKKKPNILIKTPLKWTLLLLQMTSS